jgi:serine/threonine-protein kinase
LSDPLADNDESTIVYPPFPPRTDTEEDEQTLLHNPEHFPAAGKKKRRKVMLLIALICIFAAVGASLAFLVGNGSGQNSIVLPTAVLTDEGTAGDKGMAEAGVTENRNAASVVQLPERNPLEGNRQENTSSTTDEHLAAGVLSVPPTEEEKENERQALMTSGQAKMGAGNNTGARDDFKKAMSIKATDDLLQLWTANEAMIEKKEIADRLVLYEVKSSFGELAIVREKSTRKYGAIDEKGFERIRCKYVNVDPPTDEGRAFQREDKLYDIYNTNGVRVREGVTN